MAIFRKGDRDASYDPEHEMPDPDRIAREQAEASASRSADEGKERDEEGDRDGRKADGGERLDAELELYRETATGPFNRDPERWFNRGHNLDIDYEKDRKDRY